MRVPRSSGLHSSAACWRKLRPAVTAARIAIDIGGHAASEAFAEHRLTPPRYADPRKLKHYELRMYARSGEDGIVTEIVRRAGRTDRYVDRNTDRLWRVLDAYRPRVVVVEYNASIPPHHDWVVPYVADRLWDKRVFFGASLKAYKPLRRERGYALVGCDFAGVNAFFVRDDPVAERFAGPATAEDRYDPLRDWRKCHSGLARGVEP